MHNHYSNWKDKIVAADTNTEDHFISSQISELDGKLVLSSIVEDTSIY